MFDSIPPESDDDRAVSPVIGVILMVAITVILAAVIGTFVLNLGGSVSENVQAGASVTCDAGADEIGVTWTSNQNAERLDLTFNEGGATDDTGTLSSVGSQYTYTGADATTVQVVVTAVKGDTSTVVTNKECEL